MGLCSKFQLPIMSLTYRIPLQTKKKLVLHVTKSVKHESINKFCF